MPELFIPVRLTQRSWGLAFEPDHSLGPGPRWGQYGLRDAAGWGHPLHQFTGVALVTIDSGEAGEAAFFSDLLEATSA